MARVPRTREQKKYAAAARAQLRLQQTLERIDFEEDVVFPTLDRIAELEAAGGVELNIKLTPLEIEAPKDSQ